jgi:hypothetical protein
MTVEYWLAEPMRVAHSNLHLVRSEGLYEAEHLDDILTLDCWLVAKIETVPRTHAAHYVSAGEATLTPAQQVRLGGVDLSEKPAEASWADDPGRDIGC